MSKPTNIEGLTIEEFLDTRYLDALRDLPIDGNGHPIWGIESALRYTGRHMITNPRDQVKLARACKEGRAVDSPVRMSLSLYSEACPYCGDNEYLTDGQRIWAPTPCPYPEGFITEVELDVPSGFLIIGNDYRNEFPGREDEENDFDLRFNVNMAFGKRAVTEDYARNSMLHFCVGNSCPGVYRANDNPDSFVIASPEWNENAGDDDEETFEIPGHKTCVASVVTDLWWVSIVDKDEADKRGLKYRTGHWAENEPVAVTPGRYRLRSFITQRGFDQDRYPVIYADLRRIDD